MLELKVIDRAQAEARSSTTEHSLRRPALRHQREVLREALVMQDEIAELLRGRPQTVPEIATALQAPSHEVFIWLASMLRYGRAEARGKANSEGYYTYALKEVHS